MHDPVIDVPQILSPEFYDESFKKVDALSWLSGTGVLGMHLYTQIKLKKYWYAYEDGMGISTFWILQALYENAYEVRYVTQKGISNEILNSHFYSTHSSVTPEFYINVAYETSEYTGRILRAVEELNKHGVVKVVPIHRAFFENVSRMEQLSKKIQFFNFDHSSVSKPHWKSMFEYFGFDKDMFFHHLGILHPLLRRHSECFSDRNYTILTYPIVEQNKRFQNGAIGLNYVSNDAVKMDRRMQRVQV